MIRMENLKSFKTRFLLTMLMVFAGGNLFAATQTIAVSDIAAGTTSFGDGKFTVSKMNASLFETSDNTLIMKRDAQLIIESASGYAIRQVVFDGYDCANGGHFTGNTYNGTGTSSGTTYSWVNTNRWTNEHKVVYSAVGGQDQLNATVTLTGNITITYEEDASYTPKTAGVVGISPSGPFTVSPSETKFAEPSISVTLNGEDISDYYNINYYILGQSTENLPKNDRGAQYTQDPITGSTIERIYGQFMAGNTSGDVSVIVLAIPKNDYATTYEIAQNIYSVNIPRTEPVASFNPTEVKAPIIYSESEQYGSLNRAIVAQTIALPTATMKATLFGVADVDVTDHYQDPVITLSSDENFELVDNTITAKFIKQEWMDETAAATKKSEATAWTSKTATLHYTYEPKSTYSGAYATITQDIPVTVVFRDLSAPNADKIKLFVSFDGTIKNFDGMTTSQSDTLKVYKYKGDGIFTHDLPVPIVKDEFGNQLPISSAWNGLHVKYVYVKDKIYADSCRYTAPDYSRDLITAEAESEEKALTGLVLRDTQFQTGEPGLTKVAAYVYFNDKSFGSNYKMVQGTSTDGMTSLWVNPDGSTQDYYVFSEYSEDAAFYIDTKHRIPDLILDPNPSTMTFMKGDKINMQNRFELSGHIDAAYDCNEGWLTWNTTDATHDHFSYSFDLKKVEYESDGVTLKEGSGSIAISNWPSNDSSKAYDYINTETGEINGTMCVPIDEAHHPILLRDYDSVAEFVEAYNNRWGFRFYSSKGYGAGFEQWEMEFLDDGEYSVTYTIHPYNHVRWDSGTATKGSTTVTYRVVDETPAQLDIEPRDIVFYACDGEEFTEPTVHVLTAYEDTAHELTVNDITQEDITSKYTLHYEIFTDENRTSTYTPTGEPQTSTDAAGNSVNCNTGKVSLTGTHGTIYVKVSATSDVAGYKEPTPSYYKITVVDCGGKFKYEVINACDGNDINSGNHTSATPTDTRAEKNIAKLHFIGEGKIYGGTVFNEVPGITMTIGKSQAVDEWDIHEDATVTKPEADRCCITHDAHAFFAEGHEVQVDENGIPTEGAFYVFKPTANGYLTVDARWNANEHFKLVDGKTLEFQLYEPATEVKGDHQFEKPLYAGETYYLYNMSGGDLNLHGFSYEPAFVRNDATVEKAVLFMNGYSGELPSLVQPIENTDVTFELETPANTAYATVGAHTGIVTPVAQSVTVSGLDGEYPYGQGYFGIQATVASGNPTKYPCLTKTPELNILISDIPTYKIYDRDAAPALFEKNKLSPRDTVSTRNIQTDIIMTMGGWTANVSYPYKHFLTGEKGTTADGKWDEKGYKNRIGSERPDTDPVYNQMIDGFDAYISHANDAYDERGLNTWSKYNYANGSAYDYKSGYNTGYTLPAKGCFLKFEPNESGKIFLYLVQNGACDFQHGQLKDADEKYSESGWDQDKTRAAIKTNYQMKWRPLFIVDETGKPVEMDNDFTTVEDYLSSGTEAGRNLGSYTKGLTRCNMYEPAIEQLFSNEIKDRASGFNCSFDWSQFLGTEDDKERLLRTWGTWRPVVEEGGVVTQQPDRIDIIRLDNGGFTLLTKAYVRYTWHAKAGKTYFVFQSGSKPEFGGFSFVPDGYPKKKNNDYDNDEVDLASAAIPTNQENVDVTMPARTFTDNGYSEYFTEDMKTKTGTTGEHSNTGAWAGICLPFSVNEQQVKEIFGEDVLVATLDSVRNDSLHFTQHAYRMLEAGRPYIIRPSKMTTDTKYINGNKLTFNHVSFEGVEPQAFSVGVAKGTAFEGGFEYTFKGTYESETMPTHSYVAMRDGLYFITKPAASGPFRSYFRSNATDPTSARPLKMLLSSAWVEDEDTKPITTGIMEFESDDAVSGTSQDGKKNYPNNVYNLQGQIVRFNSSSLEGLPKGIYIVKGKKYVVK